MDIFKGNLMHTIYNNFDAWNERSTGALYYFTYYSVIIKEFNRTTYTIENGPLFGNVYLNVSSVRSQFWAALTAVQ